jgi:hypothetical protein
MRFSSSRLNSARDEIATTSLSPPNTPITRTHWFSWMMGSSTASTISITTSPWSRSAAAPGWWPAPSARRCTSLPIWLAARCSISGSWPVCSPSRANIDSRPGKRFFCASAEASGAPSRTSTSASRASARIARLFSVSAAACKARRMGTPADVKHGQRVAELRAVVAAGQPADHRQVRKPASKRSRKPGLRNMTRSR